MCPLQIATVRALPMGCQRPWSRESRFPWLASRSGAPLQYPGGLMDGCDAQLNAPLICHTDTSELSCRSSKRLINN